MSLGISIVRVLRVSLRSVNSVFMKRDQLPTSNFQLPILEVGVRGWELAVRGMLCSEAPAFAKCLHSVARALRRTSAHTGASEGVRKEGLEPPYPCGYQILSLARLPVPPLSRRCQTNILNSQLPTLTTSNSQLPRFNPEFDQCGTPGHQVGS